MYNAGIVSDLGIVAIIWGNFSLDLQILLFIQEHLRTAWLTPIMRLLSLAGNAGLLWIVLAAILLLPPKTRRTGAAMLVSMGLCYLLNDIVLKYLVQRPRPFLASEELMVLVSLPTSWSFPSGHTCSSFAAACSIWRTQGKKAGIPAAILAALIGFSRMYVGVHYPTDVLCGMLVGIFGSLAVYRLLLLRWSWFRKGTKK